MRKNNKYEILKYLDFFGTTFTFYIEKHRKFYTTLGGILSLLSFFIGLIAFVFINLEEFLHKYPISTTSTSKEEHKNIKFGDEKIWIPWRIRDFGGKTINHFNLLYPIIYYYQGIRNGTNYMDVKFRHIDYKLCNETLMKNNSEKFIINMNLDQLFCIDMEDLDVGGSWDTDFLNLVTLDLYNCKDGIDYDENNVNCTTYDKIEEIAGNNNNLQFEIYYPIVNYQPMNKTNPIFIKYTNYFYHLSRFSNKIDRLYLQQHILKDDQGFIKKSIKTYSFWGIVSLNGDSYSIGNKRDLMNEGSTSRFYSFNIYIKNEIVYYNRSYKKLFLIFANGLPIVNIITTFFEIFVKTIKISSGNRKLTELLFENLKEKKTFFKIRNKENENYKTNEININASNSQRRSYNSFNDKNDSNYSSLQLKNQNNLNLIEKKNFKSLDKFSIDKIPIKSKFKSDNKIIMLNKESNKDNTKVNTIFVSKETSLNLPFSDLNSKNENRESKDMNRQLLKTIFRTQYIRKSLFPFKYYLCSIFIKNFDPNKNYCFLSKKFIVVYDFICQLNDISSYLILQREFQIMKNAILEKKQRNILEKNQKVNVNDHSFQFDMNECLHKKKLSILGKIKENNNYK